MKLLIYLLGSAAMISGLAIALLNTSTTGLITGVLLVMLGAGVVVAFKDKYQ